MSKRPTADMREIDRVHLEAMIHPVRLGAKPASEISASMADLAEVLDIISKRDLLHSARKVAGMAFYDIHFFSKPHLRHVIENAPVFKDPVVEAWYWGKLYGYSEEAIASYTDKLRVSALGAGGQSISVVVQDDNLSVLQALVLPLARLLSCCRHACHLLYASSKRAWTDARAFNRGLKTLDLSVAPHTHTKGTRHDG